MLRIAIADPHPIVRRGMRRLIEAHAGWEVCAEINGDDEAYEAIVDAQPDVAVVEIAQPKRGPFLAERLTQTRRRTRVVYFTTRDDASTIGAALSAGSTGYVLKRDGADHLEAAISAVSERRKAFSPSISEVLLKSVVAGERLDARQGLTNREIEVTRLISEGSSNKHISRALSISLKTVESHRASAMRKAEVTTGPALVRFALKQHIIEP